MDFNSHIKRIIDTCKEKGLPVNLSDGWGGDWKYYIINGINKKLDYGGEIYDCILIDNRAGEESSIDIHVDGKSYEMRYDPVDDGQSFFKNELFINGLYNTLCSTVLKEITENTFKRALDKFIKRNVK